MMKRVLANVLLMGCIIIMLGCASSDTKKGAGSESVSNLSDTEQKIQSIENRLMNISHKIKQLECEISKHRPGSTGTYGWTLEDLKKEKRKYENEYDYLIRELWYLKRKEAEDQSD